MVLTIVIFILLTLSSCVNSGTQVITQSIPSTILPIAPQIITPSYTTTPVQTATSTIIPTPTRPSLPAPAVPEVSEKISVDNISKLTQLTSLGEGDLLNMQLSLDGKWIILGTSNGILILDSTTMKQALFIPTEMKPDQISFIDGGTKLVAIGSQKVALGSQKGYIWTFPDGIEISRINFICIDKTLKNNYCYSVPDKSFEYAFGLAHNHKLIGRTLTKSFDEAVAALYRTSNGEIQYTLDYKVKTVTFSPDNKLAAFATEDKLVIIDYRDGKVIKEIPESGINSLFYYSDGKTLGAVSNNQILFFDTDSFQLIDTIKTSGIKSAFLSPDNSTLVIVSTNIIKLYRWNDRYLLNSFSGNSITFSPDGQGVAVDSGTGKVNYYKIAPEKAQFEKNKQFAGRGVSAYDYFIQPNKAGIFSSDNTKLLILSNVGINAWNKKEILIYDTNSGSLMQKYVLHQYYHYPQFLDALWVPEHQEFAFLIDQEASPDFGLLDMKSGSMTKVIEKSRSMIDSAISFNPSDSLLVYTQANRVYSWDIENNGYWQFPDYEANPIDSPIVTQKISFLPDDGIAVTDTFSQTHFYNSSDYSIIKESEGGIIFHPPNTNYHVWTNGWEIAVDDNQGNHLHRFTIKNTDFDYYAPNNLLATVSEEGVKVWDLSNLYEEKLLFTDKVTDIEWYYGNVIFSPDGKYVAATKNINGYSEVVSIWNTNDGKLIYDLAGGYSVGFAFSADSKMIAISLSDMGGSQVSIFDLSTGKSIFSTGGHFSNGDFPPKLSFSSNGKYLAILPNYGYPQVWGIP